MHPKSAPKNVIRKVIDAIFTRSTAFRPGHGAALTSLGWAHEEMEKSFTLGRMSPSPNESRYYMGPDDIVQSVAFRFK
jgi:hypothetical protein